MFDKVRNGTYMVGDFLRACPNVRSLSIVESNGFWVSAFARQPDKFEVVNVGEYGTIAKYCPSLLELNFYFIGVFDRPSFVWNNIGRNLVAI